MTEHDTEVARLRAICDDPNTSYGDRLKAVIQRSELLRAAKAEQAIEPSGARLSKP